MSKVRLEFLSWLADTLRDERTGKDISMEIDAGDNTTVRDIVREFAVKYPRFGEITWDVRNQKLSGKVAIFCNSRHIEMVNGLDTKLRNGDVLTFLPSLEGG